MKNNLKNLCKLYLIGLLIISCTSESLESEIPNEMIEDNNLTTNLSAKTIINGTPRLVGFGYEPTTDTPKSIPFDLDRSDKIIADPRIPTSVEFTFVRTEEELEKNFSSDVSIKAGGTIKKFIKLDGSFESNIRENFKLDRNHLNVVVKLQFALKREVLSGTPTLLDEANQLLNNDLREFVNRYGSTYVEDNTEGGVAYYSYVYDFTKVNQFSRSQVEGSISASLGKIFNVGGNVNVTEQQRRIASAALERSFQYSNVIGFVPKTIKTLDDFESEKFRFADYIFTNPERTTSLDLILNSYSDIFENFTFDKPEIINAGSGCENKDCVWINGNNFINNIRIEVRKADDWNIIGTYNANEIDYHNSNHITFKLKTLAEIDAFTRTGLRIFVINQSLGNFSSFGAENITYRSTLKPVVTNAGSGCSDKNCVWITGSSFEDKFSRVELRHPDTWQIIGTYRPNEIQNTNNGNGEVITLRLKSQHEINTFKNRGLRVFVVNELNGEFSSYGASVITKR